MIVEHIPAPAIHEGPLQMLVAAMDHSDYVGRIAVGRIIRGSFETGQRVALLKRDGSNVKAVAKQLFVFDNLGRAEAERIQCGDICAVVGLETVDIGDTIADVDHPEPLPIVDVDEPTLSMSFLGNDSPFFGRDGKYVNGRQIRERLLREAERDVALRVEMGHSAESFKVSGRGILHLSILMENMRREGFEFQVGQPQVIYKEIAGKKAEPIEELSVDVPKEYSGTVIEYAATRKGEMVDMEQGEERCRLRFRIPSRGLIGFRSRMLQATAGEIVMHHRFFEYEYFKGSIPQRQSGSIISQGKGLAAAFALDALQDRGNFFIEPGDELYGGQIIGACNKDSDLVVNAQKTKQLTNMRASGTDRKMKVAPAIKMSIEEALEHINDDEYVEVTPNHVRIRKIYLDENDRKRLAKGKAV
jgi:GTP-binding protein